MIPSAQNGDDMSLDISVDGKVVFSDDRLFRTVEVNTDNGQAAVVAGATSIDLVTTLISAYNVPLELVDAGILKPVSVGQATANERSASVTHTASKKTTAKKTTAKKSDK
jgi:hypothetical protein